MSGTSLGSRVGGAPIESSKSSSIVQKLFRWTRRPTVTSRTEPPFVSKYESRGLRYMTKKNYIDNYDKGRALGVKPFEYIPLAQGEIRLLELLPGAVHSTIECRLYHGVPENLPRYDALSYTWGESTPNLPIFIHQRVFLVKDNLKEALRRFRLPTQQKSAENSAEEFLRYWERIHLCLDYSKEGENLIPHDEGKLVRAVGQRGQEEYKKYIRLVRRTNELQLSISPNPVSTDEIESLLVNLEQRRKELQALWDLNATKEGKARVTVNSRLLWIDAICINQADLDERIAQIKIMRQIYQHAHSVLIWLGDDDGDGGTAIELMSRIRQKLRSRQGEIVMPANSVIDEIGVSAPWYSLAFFFSSPRFQRSWVVQECVAGARSGNTPPMLYYGLRCISWDALDDLIWGENLFAERLLELVAETWKFHPRRYPWNGDVFGFCNPGQQDTCVVRHELGQSFYTGLTEWSILRTTLVRPDTSEKDIRCNMAFWLMRIRARQATNPLDKIYSVLGLVQDLQGNGDPEDATLDALIVDYRASAEDVYSSLVRAIVVKTRNLRILGACTTRGPLIQRSWTPDWTQPREWDLATYDLMVQGTDYPTSFDASSGRESNALFADDLSTLSAEGIFWDTISFKTTTVDLNGPSTLLVLKQGHLPPMSAGELLDIWKQSSRGSAYLDDNVCSLVLWRTLVARFSRYTNQSGSYENYHPTTTWVQQFYDALEASK